MKKFIKENWFKIIITVVLISIIFVYILVKLQKDNTDPLNLFTDDKVQTTEEIWEDMGAEDLQEDIWEGW